MTYVKTNLRHSPANPTFWPSHHARPQKRHKTWPHMTITSRQATKTRQNVAWRDNRQGGGNRPGEATDREATDGEATDWEATDREATDREAIDWVATNRGGNRPGSTTLRQSGQGPDWQAGALGRPTSGRGGRRARTLCWRRQGRDDSVCAGGAQSRHARWPA